MCRGPGCPEPLRLADGRVSGSAELGKKSRRGLRRGGWAAAASSCPAAPPRAGPALALPYSPSCPAGPGRAGRPRAGGPAGAAPFLPGSAPARVPGSGRPDPRSFAERSAAPGAGPEGRPPGSHVFRTRRQPPIAESKGNEQPTRLQAPAGSQAQLPPEDAGEADRAAQKQRLHAELKQVLQRKGESQRSSAEEEGEEQPLPPPSKMEAQLHTKEKTIEMSELLEVIVETEAEAGVSGMSVAGGGKGGIFVKDVLKDSPAARALSLQEGDQILSARVYFDNIKFEDALQILKWAKPYKISFCLKRMVPSTDISHKPGASTFEVRGPKAKMARLNIHSLSSLKAAAMTKKKKARKVAALKGLAKDLREAKGRGGSGDLAADKLDLAPVDVEFSLPKFSKLRKAKSAGEVAAAKLSPDHSPRLSSLETKRRRLKFPRLKVKEAAAAALGARAEGAKGHLEVGLPKAAVELKAGTQGKAEGKVPWFTAPFSKAKKEAATKVGTKFQTPQVELGLPLPKVGAGGESPKASAKGGEGFRIQAPQFGLPKVETVLPKVSSVGLEVPEGSLHAELKLPMAEVAAPKVDVDLSLPKLEGAVPEVAPKGEGFRIKVPKFRVSAEEAELKPASIKAPTLEVTLGKGRARAEESEEKLGPGVMMPVLDVGAPSVDLEFPLPKGKVEAEVPVVPARILSLNLPKLGAGAPEEGESRLPQVELSVGKPGSPKIKARGSKIQIPGLGLSLMEHKLESKEGAAESKRKFPGVKVPSLDISAPKVSDVQLPTAVGEPPAPARRVKSEEAAEGAGFKFQMPQISLPKFDLPAKATPSPPQIHAKVSVPEVDLPLPSVKVPNVQLPKVPLQKPELALSMEKPEVEVAVPSARLSFPSAAVPTLEIDLPKVGVELDLPKVEREQPLLDHEATLLLPTLEMISKGLEVEISVPKCQADQPELSVRRSFEGPDVSGMAARIPKVDLALGKELEVAKGQPGTEVGLDLWGKALPKAGLGLEGTAVGPMVKLPSVEILAVKLPDVTVESGRHLEAESRLKSTKFALPKFSISGPKVRKGSPKASTPEAPEAADKGSKLKMPTFGITFPKSKWGAEGEESKLDLSIGGKTPKAAFDVASEPRVGVDSSESRMMLPTVNVEMPRVALDLGLPKGSGEEAAGASLEVGVDLPDIQLKVPKLSVPKFGGKGKEADLETREALAGELGPEGPKKEAKAPKFRMPSFGMMRRDVEVSGLGVEAKAKKVASSPREKPQGAFVKMPKLKLSSPMAEAEKGQLHLQPPELEVKIPQVELPKISTKEARAEEGGLLVEPESPSLQLKVPSLEIAVPGSRAEGEKPVVDMSEADIHNYEGELKTPKVPSVAVSAPRVELDMSLPTASAEESMPHGAPSTEAKIRLPKVELPKFGRGEEDGVEVAVQLLGRRLSLGREGEADVDGAAEASLLGTKIHLPKVDLSLPKVSLSGGELPLAARAGQVAVEGFEGKFKVPLVGLPTFAPKVKAPDVSKMPKFKVSGPAIKLPKFGGSSLDGEGEAEMDLPQVLRLELKAPKLRGSTEVLSLETGAKEAKIKLPSLPLGFGLSKPDVESGAGADESSKFKLKLPSVSISRAGTEASTDTQPLCPPAEGADFSFRMPQIALPDVGFSVDQESKGEAKAEAGKLAGGADLEVDVGGLKMPKIKVPAFGVSGPTGDMEAAAGGGDSEGKKLAFKVPSVEISAPSLKAHAEYEVEGAQLRHGGSQELERAGHWGAEGRKSPGGKGQAAEADAGKKYKVKIPKVGLSLPKAGLEGGEGLPGQEAETKGKRPAFVLGKPKGKGAEGSSGLLEGEEEVEGSGRGVMGRLKLRPAFGLSLSKPRTGAEVNGEPEGPSTKLKVPRLGFSVSEGAAGSTQLNGEGGGEDSLQNGAQDGKGKLGKIRLPQVELSSPSKAPEADPELNLHLVRAEGAKEEAQGGSGAFAVLKAAKFRSPKISLLGFRKRNGEAAPGAVVSSAARMEMASLESAKGEKSPKFRFPKLALSPKAHGVLEVTSEHPEDEGGLKIKLPTVGFSEELSSEEQVLEAVGSPRRVVAKAEREAQAAV